MGECIALSTIKIFFFRLASDDVFNVLNSIPKLLVEKASIDEAYLDLTPLIDERIDRNGSDSILNDVTL